MLGVRLLLLKLKLGHQLLKAVDFVLFLDNNGVEVLFLVSESLFAGVDIRFTGGDSSAMAFSDFKPIIWFSSRIRSSNSRNLHFRSHGDLVIVSI